MDIRSPKVPIGGASMCRFLMVTFLVFSLTVGLQCTDQDRIGSIEGVITCDGAPVQGATAYARPADRAFTGIVPHADSDENGHFVIQRLWAGKFLVSAKKEDEGYPELAFSFYEGMSKE